MSSPDNSASHSRIIRSFAQREDALRAKTALDDAGIESTVREYRVPDPLTRELKTRALNLCIAPADAQAAGRIMLRLPPSDAPAASTAKAEGPTRLRRGGVRSGPQKSSIYVIIFAVVGAAGMIIYAANGLFGVKKKRTPPPANRENIIVEEDLNDDGTADVLRAFTWDHIPLYHNEDRNFDGQIDVRWIWQRGLPSSRDIDLNFDGSFDQHTVYNPESQLFYTDVRPGGTGAVVHRRIFREGIPWKDLDDNDGDNHFDHLTEFNDLGDVVKKEDLPKGHPENNPPVWPVPKWPRRDDDGKIIEASP